MMDKKMCAVVKPGVIERVVWSSMIWAIDNSSAYNGHQEYTDGGNSFAEVEVRRAVARIMSALEIRPELADVRKWFHYPVVMPTKDGQGPVSEAECDAITWEVWDQLFSTHASFDNLPDAINEAMRLNNAISPPADISAALDRIKAEAWAEGMREAAGLVANEAKYFRGLAVGQHEKGIKYYEHNEYAALKLAEVAADILAAIPKPASEAGETDSKGEMK